MKKLLASVFALSVAATSHSVLADTPNWNYLQGGYEKTTLDDIDELNFTGFTIKGSRLVNDNVFMFGEYQNTSDKFYGMDFGLNQLTLGVGYRNAISENADFFGTVAFEKMMAEVDSEKNYDNGYSATIGLRGNIEQVELEGSYNYINIDSSDNFLKAAAFYNINEKFAVGAEFRKYDDAKQTSFLLRVKF